MLVGIFGALLETERAVQLSRFCHQAKLVLAAAGCTAAIHRSV